MTEYNEFNQPQEEKEEDVQYFCKFTFGQFFTILVLEVVTLAFVFYLGAKYGTDYLKIADDATPARPGVTEIVTQGGEDQVIKPNIPNGIQDAELQAMARDAVKGTGGDLKDKVQALLVKQGGTPQVQQGTPPAQTVVPEVTSTGLPAQTLQQQQASKYDAPPPPPQTQLEQPASPPPAQEPARQADSGVIRVKSPASGQFSLQVGSYPNMDEANGKVGDWRGKGYPAFMMIADIPDRGRWYRVRIGGFSSKEDAQRYLDKFKANETTEAIIVQNEQ